MTVCLLSASVLACASSEGDDGNAGSGGANPASGGSGGTDPSGSGGAPTGGSPGSGGTNTGGTPSGGAPGTGGSTGGAASGGQTGAGGSTGGETGAGGSSGGSASTCPQQEPLTGGSQYCSNSRGSAGSGYTYELWADGGGSGCMTVHGVDAAFSAEWNDVEDFLARIGLGFNQTQTHQQIGTFKAEFAETKTDDAGLTYVGIYGWTVNPLREFYIIEDWGSAEKPGGFSSDGTPRDEVGTLEADGETYDVWKKTRVDKPAITGDSETFDQYFSIRRTARQCGTISISEHFEAWEDFGLPLGNFHEVTLLMEAQFNSGSIQFTKATVTVE